MTPFARVWGARYPDADRHLLDHLVALESLFVVCCVAGMPLGAKQAMLCQPGLDNVLRGKVGRDGWAPNTEDSSYRNLRDWYIYRDYMNGLEYVIHAFDHLKKHHQ